MTTLLKACVAGTVGLLALSGCASNQTGPRVQAQAAIEAPTEDNAPSYLIGPYDQLQVFVWRAEELTTNVTVRPDGRISTPLVEDMLAAGKTPSELSADIKTALSTYVKDPEVTVIVDQFSSTLDQQIRVIGEAQQPQAIPYQTGMTVLDVMLSVGGLTEFASGNRARLIRGKGDNQVSYRVRLNDLMRRGDVTANAPVKPGDVILIPETLF
ncbi:MAG: XrtA/PEP-CTERM system exopolysaccharide export protein [Pseudomonadota bacterium]